MNSIEAHRSDPATDLDDISSLVDMSVPDDWSPLDTRAVDTIRVLAADAVQRWAVGIPEPRCPWPRWPTRCSSA